MDMYQEFVWEPLQIEMMDDPDWESKDGDALIERLSKEIDDLIRKR